MEQPMTKIEERERLSGAKRGKEGQMGKVAWRKIQLKRREIYG